MIDSFYKIELGQTKWWTEISMKNETLYLNFNTRLHNKEKYTAQQKLLN